MSDPNDMVSGLALIIATFSFMGLSELGIGSYLNRREMRLGPRCRHIHVKRTSAGVCCSDCGYAFSGAAAEARWGFRQ